MTNQELFESIQMGHKEKKVLSLSKKLVKKCSFNRGSDVENLCHLAYWLYVYGCEDEALKLCEITHEVEFPGKGVWNVWDRILLMWGLEVQIYKNRNMTEMQTNSSGRWIICGAFLRLYRRQILNWKRSEEIDSQ